MIPEVFVDNVGSALTGGRLHHSWVSTHDVPQEVSNNLASLRQLQITQVEEIAVKIFIYDEMPILNFSSTMLKEISDLGASLDIDIIKLENNSQPHSSWDHG